MIKNCEGQLSVEQFHDFYRLIEKSFKSFNNRITVVAMRFSKGIQKRLKWLLIVIYPEVEREEPNEKFFRSHSLVITCV